ncbi:MAG: glutaminyl-peptide cyclotransferase [Labedaea sp.]
MLAAGCAAHPAAGPAPNRLHAEVLQAIPHDTTAFTEGLELTDGVLYEGTGLKGSSTLRVVDPATGQVRQQTALPKEFFGEGITVTGPNVWQLTWQDGVAIQRDRATLAERRRVNYTGEGWGLCLDAAANRLVMSDGTDRLTFRDPDTFQQTGSVRVAMAGQPVTRLNELECAHGAVFANVWQTDTVVRIDPASGVVTDEINLAGLLPAADRAHADVLNGIAAIPGTDEFLVTGKYWPQMYRVRFVA